MPSDDEKPDFSIGELIVMAHRATDLLTHARLSSSEQVKWGRLKAASMALRMVSEQLNMHANAMPQPVKKDKEAGK